MPERPWRLAAGAGSTARGVRGRLAGIPAWLLLVGLAALCGRDALAAAWSLSHPHVVGQLAPGAPQWVELQATRLAARGEGVDKAALRRALVARPLAPRVLRQLALAEDPTLLSPAAAQAPDARALALLELSHRLSRRDEATQMLLALAQMRAGQWERSAVHVDAALSTREADLAGLRAPLIAALAVPELVAVMERLMHRPWAMPLLLEVLDGADARLLARLAARVPGIAADPQGRRVLAGIVTRLAEAGEWEVAAALVAGVDEDAAAALEGVGFAQAERLRPYLPLGWWLAGVAERQARVEGGRLVARLAAAGRGLVATRVMLLAPGAYRLAGSASAAPPAEAVEAELQLRCLPGPGRQVALARVNLFLEAGEAAPLRADFDVGQACRAVEFRVLARNLDPAREGELRLEGVALRARGRVGGGGGGGARAGFS